MSTSINENYRDLGEIIQGTSPALREYILDQNHAVMLKASIASIQMRIFDITAGESTMTLEDTSSLVVNDVWLDTPETGKGWVGSPSAPGYNFQTILPSSILQADASGSRKRYQIEIRGTPTSGPVFPISNCRIYVKAAGIDHP